MQKSRYSFPLVRSEISTFSVVLACIVGVVFLGCDSPSGWPVVVSDVEAVANREVLLRENWESAESKLIEISSDGCSTLVVSKLPKTPGSQRYVTLKGGKVVKYLPGL
jgi:hypothetical protein